MSASIEQSTPPRRSNRTLWLILFVCLLPIVGSTLLFYFGPQGDGMNYGELIAPPRQLPKLDLPDQDGRMVSLESLRGRWIMVQVDSGACGTPCREKLYKMRQVRLTQGKNMDRVRRLWLIDDTVAVDGQVRRDYEGTMMLRADAATMARLKESLPATAAPEAYIWLVDPLGNVMLRFPPEADPSRMKNDLTRLLRVSRIE